MKIFISIIAFIILFTATSKAETIREGIEKCEANEYTQALCGMYIIGVQDAMIVSAHSDKMLCITPFGVDSVRLLFNQWANKNAKQLGNMDFKQAVMLFFITEFDFKEKKTCAKELKNKKEGTDIR